MSRPRAAWRSTDQEIGPRCQLDETVEISIGRSGDSLPVVIADLHVETARGAVRDPGADGSKTENAQTLAGNGRGIDTPLLLPSAGVYVTISLTHVPGRCHQQHHGGIGDSRGVRVRAIGDRDAP